MRRRKTDYGTIILHWLVVGAICVAFVTGLRIAAETPDRTWINWLDAVLPRAGVWVPHMEAAVVLTAVSIGYAIYLTRSGLTRRVAAGLDLLRHDAGTDRQRRLALFRVLRRLRHGDDPLVRDLDHSGFRSLPCAGPLCHRPVVTIAQNFPSGSRTAAATAP